MTTPADKLSSAVVIETPSGTVLAPRRLFVYVCGILNKPGDARNFTGRAVTYTHIQGKKRGELWWSEKIEYTSDIVFRFIAQNRRIQKLALMMDYYSGWPSTIVCHSNGAAVAVECLRRNENLTIDNLHLVSAACEPDFNKNGLNRLLVSGAVKNVYIYIGGLDGALKLAASEIGRFLGYGALGRIGPMNVLTPNEDKVHVFKSFPWSSYGHSTAFSDERFEQTMEHFFV